MKEKIIDCAIKMFIEYGFKSVTMDDLSNQLGVSKKTIYEYFDTKTELIEVCTLSFFNIVSCNIDHLRLQNLDPIHETFAINNMVLEHLKNEKASTQFQLQKYYPNIFKGLEQKKWDKMYLCYKENLKRGIQQNYYRKEIDVETVFRLYYSSINLLKNQEMFPSILFTQRDITHQFLVYHIRGIASPKGIDRLQQLLSEQQIS